MREFDVLVLIEREHGSLHEEVSNGQEPVIAHDSPCGFGKRARTTHLYGSTAPQRSLNHGSVALPRFGCPEKSTTINSTSGSSVAHQLQLFYAFLPVFLEM